MWLALGIIVTALVAWLVYWLKGRGLAFTWYEWIIGIVGLLLLLFTIQNWGGAQAELVSKAANMFLLITGLPAIILLALTAALVARHKTKTST